MGYARPACRDSPLSPSPPYRATPFRLPWLIRDLSSIALASSLASSLAPTEASAIRPLGNRDGQLCVSEALVRVRL